MNNKINFFEIKLENLLFYSFCLFPVSFLIGNLVINSFLFFFSCVFLIGIIKKKFIINKQNKINFYLLLFLFTSFLINLIFSNNTYLSIPRVLKFIFIIGSILSFGQLLIIFDKNKINKIYKFWSIIFAFVVMDIIFELILGFNILGFTSIIPGRIGSFTGKEMNIGHFFFAFSLISLSYISIKLKKIPIIFLVSISLIFISFLIGERSNFIKTFLIISIFIFFSYQIKMKYKFFSFLSILVLITATLHLNENYNNRYFKQIANKLANDGINNYLNNSIYGAHFKVAIEIFKDNPVFGVGIKNFRIESFDKKYDNLDHNLPERRGNTHPHQIHLELLSETGLFGYLSFLIFIIFSIFVSLKNYFLYKNLFQLSSILFVFISLLPLLPSGSFFTTYSAGLFWLHYSIMVGYNNLNN